MRKNLNKIGSRGEALASNYLIAQNYQILSRNFRSKFGEIDIIAKKNNIFFFIEVKTRETDIKGMPYEAVNQSKIRHILKSAYVYINQNQLNNQYKIAVISIILENNEIKFYDDIRVL